jgi:hypothetical protein
VNPPEAILQPPRGHNAALRGLLAAPPIGVAWVSAAACGGGAYPCLSNTECAHGSQAAVPRAPRDSRCAGPACATLPMWSPRASHRMRWLYTCQGRPATSLKASAVNPFLFQGRPHFAHDTAGLGNLQRYGCCVPTWPGYGSSEAGAISMTSY